MNPTAPINSAVETWHMDARSKPLLPECQKPRPFAVLLLRGLQTRFFREESDMLACRDSLVRRNRPHVCFRYHEAMAQFVPETESKA